MSKKENFLIQNREYIEWTNTWIENSTEIDADRILLIGDSVLRQIRGKLGSIVGKNADFVGTSRALSDPSFYNIFDAFFLNNIYKYSKVLINIGTNHGHYLKTNTSLEYKKEYSENFENFIKYIMQKFPNIVILLGTPWTKKDNTKVFDNDFNEELLSKNKIQTEIANKYGLKTVDLYSHIMQNKEYYKYTDHVHFVSLKIKNLLEKYIASAIYPEIKINLKPPKIADIIKSKIKNLFGLS